VVPARWTVVDRVSLPLADPADLGFLAPGLLHQFGNLFLTIHGNALVLEGEHVERAKAAIHGACERGSGSLRLLRALQGENGVERVDARVALRQLAELLRVPVREAGHGFESDGDALLTRPVPLVELGTFVPVVVRAVRELLAAVPAGVSGVLSAALVAHRDVALLLRFQPPAGVLPFPLQIDAARRQLQQHAVRCHWPHPIRSRPDGLELALAAAPVARDVAEA
jgi:hypothetical protein